MTRFPHRGTVAAMAAVLALGACSGDGTPEVTAEDVERIEQAIANGSALSWELTLAESRVAKHCMEDLGFTAHHPYALHGSVRPNRFDGFASPYSRIPDRETAATFGFGMWVHHSELSASDVGLDPDEFAELVFPDDMWPEDDHDAMYERWDQTDADYQERWYTAFHGEERRAWQEELSRSIEDGSFDPEATGDEPPFGGCELATIQTVYGGPRQVDSDWGAYWTKPSLESPLVKVGDGDVYKELLIEFADEEAEFLACVHDRGRGEWEFDSIGWMQWSHHFDLLYFGEPMSSPEPEGIPEPPSDVPDDDRARFDYEVGVAVDFAECADEGGLREDAEAAYARLYVQRFIEREPEIFAWQEEIQDYLDNAQSYLAG